MIILNADCGSRADQRLSTERGIINPIVKGLHKKDK